MTTQHRPEPHASAHPGKRRRTILAKENRRLLYGLVIGAIVAAFAVVNLEEVEVDWIFGTAQTPLIVVIALSFALGVAAGWIGGGLRRRGRS